MSKDHRQEMFAYEGLSRELQVEPSRPAYKAPKRINEIFAYEGLSRELDQIEQSTQVAVTNQ